MTRLLGSGLILLTAGVLTGCPFGPVECTTEARPALLVEVVDSVTGADVIQGAHIIARDGEFEHTVEVLGSVEGPAQLAHERAGTYTVTVEREGYRLWSRTGVRVTRGECHVRTVSLTARLQR